MERDGNKSIQSLVSITSDSASSEVNNGFKFAYVSFLENSNTSLQEVPIPKPSVQNAPQPVKSVPISEKRQSAPPKEAAPEEITKIIPLSTFGPYKPFEDAQQEVNEEKTLMQMGFRTNQIEGWEGIRQPLKQNLYDLLRNMIENFIKSNVQIRIATKSFNCHMMVLQCYSDFFMDFSNESCVELPAEKVSPKAFAMIYDWMLSPKPLVQREGILLLFNAANFLKIKGLVDQCWVCLDDDLRFQEDTAFLLYLEAKVFGNEMLKQLMLTRICKFFLTLVASKDFLLLSAEEICALLRSNSIGVNSEAEILMSAIRWLTHKWNERQSQMLDILRCIRFGLVPAWMLVSWQREIDSYELNQIVHHPAVKEMIEDGLSYATTKLFYPNETDLLTYLERYGLTKPIQRQWIWDYECNYHHNRNCPNRDNITYESFCEYLDMIRNSGKDHWKKIQMVNQECSKQFQCCCPEANLNSNQQLYSVIQKESRDQGVQVSVDMNSSDRMGNNRTSQSPDVRTSLYQEIYVSNRPRAALGSLEHRNILKTTPQSSEPDVKVTITREDNKNLGLRDKSSSCCDVNQKAINNKRDISAKSNGSQEHEVAEDDQPRPSRGRARIPMLEEMSPNMYPAGRYQTEVTRLLDPQSESKLRIGNQKILLFGGMDPYVRMSNDNHGRDVLYYDSCEYEWKHLTSMPGKRLHHSAVLFRGMIYVIGGTRPNLDKTNKPVFETAVWKFDPNRLVWHNECTLPQPRRDFGLIAYDNDATGLNDAGQGDGMRCSNSGLYIIGGENIEGIPLSSTLFYNVDENIWTEKASLNIGRYGLVAAVVNTTNAAEIWIAGGACGRGLGGRGPTITDTIECYNLNNDDGSWKQSGKRLRIPRLFGRFCSTGDGKSLYIIGGIGWDPKHPGEFLSLSSVDCYDFEKEQWTRLTDMVSPRHGHDVVQIKDKILVFGGASTAERKTLKSVECYCIESGRWLDGVFTHLPSALSGMAAVVIDCDT